MRRKLLASLWLAALLLQGCSLLPRAPQPLVVPVGVLGEPLGAAPLLLAQPDAVHFEPALGDQVETFLIAPSNDLPALAAQGYVALGAICAAPPDSLLWHRTDLFSWTDLHEAPVYAAKGADLGALAAALARYRGILSPQPKPLPAQGGVGAFQSRGDAFLLAPEPLASDLLQKGNATLAQALPDELGPYPSCVVYGQSQVVRGDPLLTLALLRALDLGLWQLQASDATVRLALQLRPLSPGLPPTAIGRALQAARAQGVFRDAVALSPAALEALLGEFPARDLPPGAIDQRPARQALDRPFP